MSRDPSAPATWRHIIAAALAGQWTAVVDWAGKILFEINRQGKKPSKDVYAFLMNSFAQARLFNEAVKACQMALSLDPQNNQLQEALRDLWPEYHPAGPLRRGRLVHQVGGRPEGPDGAAQGQPDRPGPHLHGGAGRQGPRQYEAEPTVAGKVNALVDALIRFDNEAYENEAIDVLLKAFKESAAYRYKMRVGDIKMRQMSRQYQKLLKAGDKEAAKDLARQQLAFELQEFIERAANYPTDLGLKFELGRRQFLTGQHDEAIGSLQQARRDPKRRLAAMNYLGLAFFKKGWQTEAADTFQQALDGGADGDCAEGNPLQPRAGLRGHGQTQGSDGPVLGHGADRLQLPQRPQAHRTAPRGTAGRAGCHVRLPLGAGASRRPRGWMVRYGKITHCYPEGPDRRVLPAESHPTAGAVWIGVEGRLPARQRRRTSWWTSTRTSTWGCGSSTWSLSCRKSWAGKWT